MYTTTKVLIGTIKGSEVTKRSNIIQINGRRYDASTGELINEKPPVNSQKSAQKIDGFAKVASPTSRPRESSPVLSAKEVKQEARRRAKHASELHKSTAKSKTLVRSSTKKPKARSFRSKILTSATAFTGGKPDSAKNELAESVSTDKLKHAKTNKQSASISRFAGSDVAPATNTGRVSSVSKPTKISKKNQLIAAQMAKVDTSTDAKHKQKSGKNPVKKAANYVKRSPKITTIVATSLAALMLFGYITYLNVPNMALRVAAVKAGFSANMPGYSPNGFKFTGPIAYSPGQITIQYSSNTDERQYNITERETSWDSKSLLDNFVRKEVSSDSLYSTVYDRGLTVYIYAGSNAAWVNGGVWYTVSGDSLLSSEQLLRIAASL